MKQLLGSISMSLEDMVDTLHIDSDAVFSAIAENPEVYVNELMTYIASEGPRLSNQIRHFLVSNDAPRDPVFTSLAERVKSIGIEVDIYARDMGRSRCWSKISKGPLDVIAVWRNKSDEIHGDPKRRKVVGEDIEVNTCSIAMMESESGANGPVLVVSDNQYRAGAAQSLRQDFLIDLSALIVKGIKGKSEIGRVAAHKAIKQSANLMTALLKAGQELSEHIGSEDPDCLYYPEGPKVEVRRELKAEENPNALIEIGGWS